MSSSFDNLQRRGHGVGEREPLTNIILGDMLTVLQIISFRAGISEDKA